ncbi:MAG: hypothetical protein GTN84_14840 [Hydrogenophaga sp.]|uniref:uroporphyrinogen-III C-methyltransferase n=1 Tax=Hydrogenophaga sp. TaxID=1904254 RepID=UPI00168F7893|nr:uroporphyrinogen-III C-methyltransferase [Hydrogenophaga sp.]NIM42443.1 hypothetical protein [Hydrogenophaga sp.]NIN27594.1 hypothetical protein [Hydrogenophaga sp.]NIN32414.1 hypothetical protein [Hydrogenophaga sp.]NIN56865.1 hypothetical protein [Hydrogenophaga sp.]NIO53010.1 hypothetical protein [Hydrogenophaga sp.]
MNAPDNDTAPVAAPAPSAHPPASPLPEAPRPARPAVGLTLLALLVAAAALVMAGMLWQRLNTTQAELARRAHEAELQVVEARTVASQAEAQVQELQARLGVAEVRLSEVSLQRSQLEELMLSLSRSRDDNLIQDLEASLRLALQQSQLTGSAQPLVSALQAADQRIQRAAQPRLNPVQRAIARDVDRIRAAALADIPNLALQIDELVRQVDNWPTQNAVGVERAAPRAPRRATAPAGGATSSAPAAEAGPPPAASEPEADSSPWQRFAERWNRWWREAFVRVVQGSRDLVHVSRIDHPDAALLAPEQAFFLRENIKLKLLNARLALLARQMNAARADVVVVEGLLKQYFDGNSPAIASALGSLGRLRRDLVSQDLPRPDDTLAALAAAAGGR